jgi:hypothetical protein
MRPTTLTEVMRIAKLFVLVATLIAGGAPVAAAPSLATENFLQCAIKAVMACTEADSCVRGTAATVALPPVLEIDVKAGIVRGDRSGRTVRITSQGTGGGRLMFHGQEVEIGGRAWNVVIAAETGAMTAAVLSEPGGYLMFGRCEPKS